MALIFSITLLENLYQSPHNLPGWRRGFTETTRSPVKEVQVHALFKH